MVEIVFGVGHYIANINPLCVVMDDCRKAITVAAHIKNGETIHIIDVDFFMVFMPFMVKYRSANNEFDSCIV